MIQLKAANDLATLHGVKCITYGRAGTGKTVLTATCPTPVVISAEAGLLSLRKANLVRLFGENTAGITYDIPVITIKTMDDLIAAELWARTSAEARQFQTVCIDSISEVAEVVLSNARANVKDPRQAYGELLMKMSVIIKAFRDLPNKHVYMSAKEERIKDESTNVTLSGPSMPGNKLGQGLPYFYDEVFYLGRQVNLQTKEENRFIGTSPTLQYDAKDRSGALAPVEYPHLGYIFNKILSSQ